MKALCMYIIALTLSFSMKGQEREYPKMIMDKNGKDTLVVFTIMQAREIDNDNDQLEKYKIVRRKGNKLLRTTDMEFSSFDNVIKIQDTKAWELENMNRRQDSLIKNKFTELAMSFRNTAYADAQLTFKDSIGKSYEGIIKKQDGEIFRQGLIIKSQKTFTVIGLSVGALGLLFGAVSLALLHH